MSKNNKKLIKAFQASVINGLQSNKHKKDKKIIKNLEKSAIAFWASDSNGLQRIQNKRARITEKILYTENSRSII